MEDTGLSCDSVSKQTGSLDSFAAQEIYGDEVSIFGAGDEKRPTFYIVWHLGKD